MAVEKPDGQGVVDGPSKQPVQPVESSNAVSLSHRRVIERRIDEVIQRVVFPRLRHDRLADVDDLGRVLPEAVDAEQLQCLPVKQQFEHSHRLASNLSAGEALETAVSDLVRNPVLGQEAQSSNQSYRCSRGH